MMIYVWAMEQKRRKFEKQDLLIPWNIEPRTQILSDNLRNSWQPDLNTISLNQHFNKVHASTTQRIKSSSFLDDQPSLHPNELYSSKFLANSLDSGLNKILDSGDNEQNHGSIFRRLYNLCIDIKRGRNTNSSKPLHFFRKIGDFVPNNVQTLENNTNMVKELWRSPWKSPAVELGKEISDFNVVPLPLGSKYREVTDSKRNFTMSYTNPGDNKTRNKADKISGSYDHERVSPEHQLLQGVNHGCLRYYHIFKQGELSDLIEQCVPELRVVQTFFDHSNWCVIAEKIQL